VKALVLLAWSMLAVATIDNFLYPFLVGEKLRIHTVPTVLAVLGGIVLTGPVGLILGPLVLAITIALLDIWKWRTAAGRTAEEAVTPSVDSPRPAA
jgi:predicted PurR-regulated permease PerM